MSTLTSKPVRFGAFTYLRVTGKDATGKKVRVMARTVAGAEAIRTYCAPGGWTVAGVQKLQLDDADAHEREISRVTMN